MLNTQTIISIFLVFIPISIAANFMEWGSSAIFITSAIAIIPLAGWMGTATEEIAVVLGPNLGGLLNATFGNATELIIGIIALNAGLVSVVKASITGSIIGNLLLVMGLSMFLGGLRFKEQKFQSVVARLNASAMNLAVIAILVPTAVNATSDGISENTMQNLSGAVAIVLITVYILTLLFSMKTHSYLYEVGVAGSESEDLDSNSKSEENTEHKPNLLLWILVLLIATLAVAYETEILVDSLEEATANIGLSALFTGVIVVPIFCIAAENATDVTVAF